MYTAYIIQHIPQVIAMKYVYSEFEAVGCIKDLYFTNDDMILVAFLLW